MKHNFSYIDKAADLTLDMINMYKDSFILLGDEKQLYHPLTNSYVGIGQSTYEWIVGKIGNISAKNLEIQVVDRDEWFNMTMNNRFTNGFSDSYTSIYLKFNPNKEILLSKYFQGDLIGNAYTAYALKTPRNITLYSYDYYIGSYTVSFDGSKDIQLQIPTEITKSLHDLEIVTSQALNDLNERIGNINASFSDIVWWGNKIEGNTVKGNISYTGNITPETNNIYSIGSSDLKYKNIYANSTYSYLYGNVNGDLYGYHYGVSYGDVYGNLYGNAYTSSKLKEKVKINNTYFDGSESIITSYWGETRKIRIYDYYGLSYGSYVSVNGSQDIGLDLPETIHANIVGTSTYARYLNTPKKINGTVFDNSKDITTSYWGNAREFVITDYNKTNYGSSYTVNGYNNVVLSLPNKITADLQGTSNNAYQLYYSYHINGTVFNGTKDILTSYWGETRKIRIYDYYGLSYGSYVSVNGSQDIGLDLPETIHASQFIGNFKGNLTGNVYGDLIGNAYTAYALKTPRNITLYSYDYYIGSYTVSFDGSKDIQLQIPTEITKSLHDLEIVTSEALNDLNKREETSYSFLCSIFRNSSWWGQKLSIFDFNIKGSLENANGIFPEHTYIYNIGKDNLRYNTIYASYFKGLSDLANISYYSYVSYIKNTSSYNTYYISFVNKNQSYNYINNSLFYNPYTEFLCSTYIGGQINPEDQWGVM